MRSLFTKILLWFLATTLITSAGVALTTALIFEPPEQRRPPFPSGFSGQVEEARHAWETGGAAALTATLGGMRHRNRAELFLTGANGRDLLTGKDYSQYLPAHPSATRRFFSFFFRRRGFAHPSEDGRYYLVAIGPPPNGPFWFLRPQHLWVLGMGVLLCYWLAYHLSSPVRKLQRAVDRFGRGDFSARADSNRGDELGQLARTFDLMADRIQTLVTAERRLLVDISHELRSPLARLSVAIELARSESDRAGMLDRIQREADRLNELIGELLEITRAEGDPSTRRREPLELTELLADVVDACRIEATPKDCSLRILRADPIELSADAELLRRAIENVVRNAIRYAPHGTSIDAALIRDADAARLTIRDFGPGVPQESLTRIFDPFYRVDSARGRSSGGVGMGLSIARRAVELHGGQLTARNSNPGLEVTLELPLLSLQQLDAGRQSEQVVG